MPEPPTDLSHLDDVRNLIEQDCPEVIVGRNLKQKPQIIDDQDYTFYCSQNASALFILEIERHSQIGQVIYIEFQWIEIHCTLGHKLLPGNGKNKSPVTEGLSANIPKFSPN